MRNLIALLFCLACCPLVQAEFDESMRLSTREIHEVFANTRDDAQVQDAAGTTATNLWYPDGRFTNTWSNGSAEGMITGRWYAAENKRCVLIQTGLPQAIGATKCSPIYRRGSDYISVNADGTIHGIHRLSPMTPPE